MAKAAFNKKRTLFTSTLDLERRKKLLKCYIWSTALYGAETWTLRAVHHKQLQNVESFKYLGSILTNDGRCTCEIKCMIVMAKAAFNKKRTLFTSTLHLELRKKLVKCYIWSMVLKLGRFGQYIINTWKILKCGAGEGWKRSVGLIM